MVLNFDLVLICWHNCWHNSQWILIITIICCIINCFNLFKLTMYSPFASCSEYETDDESSKDVAKVLLPFYHDTGRTYPFDTSPPTNRPSVNAVWSSHNAHIFKGTPTFDRSTNPNPDLCGATCPCPYPLLLHYTPLKPMVWRVGGRKLVFIAWPNTEHSS